LTVRHPNQGSRYFGRTPRKLALPCVVYSVYNRSSVSSVDDLEKLQQALFEHANWSHNNNTRCKSTNCNVISTSRKKTLVTFNYHLRSLLLLHETEEKALGIIVNNNISWDSYIYFIAAKANKVQQHIP